MVYQYLGEDDPDLTQTKLIAPYRASYTAPMETAVYAPAAYPAATAPVAPPRPALSVIPLSGYVGPAPSGSRPAPVNSRIPVPRRRTPRLREDRALPIDFSTPDGFVRSFSRHFTILAEQYPASERFIELIESLHSNLMLDLAPFSPWASNERVTIFLFKNQETYRRATGRPAWSGGASSAAKRKLYVYESEDLPGIVAHELTHVYFDGFFLKGTNNPLWLSEGMATLVQVERGLAAPNWLHENLEFLRKGDGFSIGSLTAVTSTAGWPDTKVRLWYAQCYSLVRFLVRTQYRSSFYKFSIHLRNGRPGPEALYRAYGAPYTRMAALEYAWRYEISRTQRPKLRAQPLVDK